MKKMKSNVKNRKKFNLHKWMVKNKKKMVSAVCILIVFTMLISTFAGIWAVL